MSVIVVIGAQWGDEGKGKIVDVLSEEADVCVRFNGGNNAGHTIINEYGNFALHLVPAGIFRKETICVIGNGTVVHLQSLHEEMKELMRQGIPEEDFYSRLAISLRAHLVMPWHILFDKLQEKSRGKDKIGTTLRGIGPTFTDKVARRGMRVGDLLLPTFLLRAMFLERSKEAVRTLRYLQGRRKVKKQKVELSPEDEIEFSPEEAWREFEKFREYFIPFIADTETLLWDAWQGRGMFEREQRILLEGAQGVHLDPDFGTYPYVTSSPCTVAGACQGSGLPPCSITRVIGVAKAFTTRVAAGPFPTEMDKGMGDLIRERGREFGATTGRPRRIGWLDLSLLQYTARHNGVSEWALTKLDTLSGIDPLFVCYLYEDEDAKELSLFDMGRARPMYVSMNGWKEDLETTRSFDALPSEAQDYIQLIEDFTGVPVGYISVGPHRDQVFRK